MIIEVGNIEEVVLNILQQEDLLSDNREKLFDDLSLSFPTFEECNQIIVRELIASIDNNPQEIIDIIRSSLLDAKNITTMIANHQTIAKEEKSLHEKMQFIAIVHELRSFLRLGSFLINGRMLADESKKVGSDTIFVSYSLLGLDFDLQLIRKIRNAYSHRFHFEANKLIDDRGVIVTDDATINEIYQKLVILLKWYRNFIFRACYRVPKFGVLIANTCYHELQENKKDYASYFDGLKIIAPQLFAKRKVVKKGPPKIDGSISSYINMAKYRLKEALTFRGSIEIRLSKNRYHNVMLYKQNLLSIEQNLDRQLDLICIHLIELNITNKQEKERIEKTIQLLKQFCQESKMRIRNIRLGL